MSVRDKLVKVVSIIIDHNLCTGGGQKAFLKVHHVCFKKFEPFFFILQTFFFILQKLHFSSSFNTFQQYNTNIFPTHDRNMYPYLGIGALVFIMSTHTLSLLR